ncbi:hypothetical protein BDV06DRAFT_214107 [Aspergillus oleicola]
MKVILAGATGFIGQELLAQCIANPTITSIIALTRRELPNAPKNDKLRTYIMTDDDWTSYSNPALKSELQGAKACLWTIGLTPAKAKDDDITKKVSVELPKRAAEAFSEAFSKAFEEGKNLNGDGEGDGKGKFRFVFISGTAAVRDQNQSLWYWGDFRRLRGESENVLFRHEEANPSTFETYIMRPGPVPSGAWSFKDTVAGLLGFVDVHILARAMIRLALNGNEDGERTFYNNAMRELGEK